MKRLLALLACVAVAGCGSSAGPITLARAEVARAAAPPADATSAAAAVNAFGFDLLRAMRAQGDAVVSPASIALALAMARAGAAGATASQMDAVLHDAASDAHPTWLNALEAAIASRTGTFKDANGQDQRVALRIANATFSQQGMALKPAFLGALGERFGAGVRLVDFEAATEAARQAINSWVSDQTEQRIKELLSKGVLDDQSRLVLVNAIYLKAAWLTPFDPKATKPAPFTHLDGSTAEVPTMHLVAELPYAEGTGWRAVELPYVGGSLAMTVIVPDDLAAFTAGLDAATFQGIAAKLAERKPEVTLALPIFGTETKTDLKTVLAGLGMADAFDPDRADFSGITDAERLYITAVVHQANIDVDEKGTEASAATAVVMGRTSLPSDRVTFNVDHPFLFALRDVPTGAIVFLGQITTPAARS
ncbi:MAG TPA: serpin family protein [Candidatus Limnocylindrales bacterium]|nr:serpin family protein [Candidatus Limnocylindrales bacterium]